MEIRLDGRVALVTGASKGLGRATATAFARAGADVALVARGPEALDEARAAIAAGARGQVRSHPCDVTDPRQIEALYAAVVQDLGRVDILVNNAGSSLRGPFESLSDEAWQGDLDLKLFAAIRLCRLAFPDMKARRWGRILNVLNTGAKAPPAEGAPTAVSRAAGMALTKVLANEGAAHGVLVNAMLVGLIESDQWVRRHRANAPEQSLEAFYADMGRDLPMGRLGKAEEFANLACFLASDAASYLTGTAINVDGGRCPVV